MAISTKFARAQIRCVHHWMLGRILGLRLQCGEGRRAGDVCVISACAPVHDERTQTVIRQISNRCRVILCMDANGQVFSTLPWIGSAGNQIRDRRRPWTPHGYDLLELMRSVRLVTVSAHGEANRQCWTWLSPFGTRHRLEFLITHLTDADHGKVKVDCRMPVGLSGFSRSQSAVCTRVHARAGNGNNMQRKNQSVGTERCQKESIGFNKIGNVRLGKGKLPPVWKNRCYLVAKWSHLTLRQRIVKRALDTICTVPHRKARTLPLPAEILALAEQKQRFLRRWRRARRLCENEQLSRQYKSQAAVVTGAVRVYKRRRLD